MIIRNLPIEKYHESSALSNSKIGSYIEKGALWYRGAFIDKTIEQPDSKAFKKGRLFDAMVTGGQTEIDANYVLQPATYTNKKNETKPWHNGADACKEWNAEREAEGKEVVSQADWDNAAAMMEAVLQHQLAKELLALCEFQVSLRQKFAKWGVEIQARPDGLSRKPHKDTRGKRFTLDVKTTADFMEWVNETNPGAWSEGSPIHKYGYHRQGALDNCLCSLEPEIGETIHLLLVVEKAAPYRVAVVELTEAYLEIGWKEIERHGAKLASYITSGKWPTSPQGIISMGPPAKLIDREQRIEQEAREVAAGAA